MIVSESEKWKNCYSDNRNNNKWTVILNVEMSKKIKFYLQKAPVILTLISMYDSTCVFYYIFSTDFGQSFHSVYARKFIYLLFVRITCNGYFSFTEFEMRRWNSNSTIVLLFHSIPFILFIYHFLFRNLTGKEKCNACCQIRFSYKWNLFCYYSQIHIFHLFLFGLNEWKEE